MISRLHTQDKENVLNPELDVAQEPGQNQSAAHAS